MGFLDALFGKKKSSGSVRTIVKVGPGKPFKTLHSASTAMPANGMLFFRRISGASKKETQRLSIPAWI